MNQSNTVMKRELLANSAKVSGTNQTPSIHCLKLNYTHDNPDDKIRKCELGQSSAGVIEKVIMVVGATGVGKTTLINRLVNYVLGVHWEDDFRFQLNEESNQGSQNKTSWVTSYTLHHREGFQVPYSVTVIDTPGFGDTLGITRDNQISKQIHKFFTTTGDNGIGHIDAIGFVTQAALPRLNPAQQFIFDEVLALFGRDMSDNIFLLVTCADNQTPLVLEGVKTVIPFKKFYKFNNVALCTANGTKELEMSDSDDEDDEDDFEDDDFNKMFWKMGEKSFRNFFKKLSVIEVKGTSLTKDVLNERQRLQTHVSGIQECITTGLNKLEELRVEVDVLKRHETDIEMNKEFTYTVTEETAKKEEIPRGIYITNCLTCNRTCHYPCQIPDDEKKRGCYAMDDGKCRVCPSRCDWTVHKNMTYKIVMESVTKTKTTSTLKNRYDNARAEKVTTESLIKIVIDDFNSMQLKVLFYTDEVRKSLQRLREIALKPNVLSTVEYIDICIIVEESRMAPGWQARLRQLEIVKKKAEILERLATEGFDPFKEYQNTFSNMVENGEGVKSVVDKIQEMFIEHL